ncbi:MAG: T9SS type A sorting domain-containing protein [Flavobacteriales bacterium]
MRTSLLLGALVLLPGLINAQIILVDQNFDAYAEGSPIAQTIGPPWTTWSTVVGTTEEAAVSNEMAYSGANSGKWVSVLATGGPTDMVVELGDQTSGVWSIGFKMYIPSGKGGYFNLLHAFASANSDWAAEISFVPEGDIRVLVQGTPVLVGTYSHDTWFDVNVLVDLDMDNTDLSINGALLYTWPFSWDAQSTEGGVLVLAAMNLFAYAGGTGQATYYIDDLLVASVSDIGIVEEGGAIRGLYPNPATDRMDVLLTPGQGSGRWAVRDMIGRAVRQGSFLRNAERATIDVEGLRPGTYLFELEAGTGRQSRRFVKR